MNVVRNKVKGPDARETSRVAKPNIRLLALLEATTVTGVAKNVLDFCRAVRELERAEPGAAPIQTTLVTFKRSKSQAGSAVEEATDPARAPNEFVRTARTQGVTTDVIAERFRFDLRVVASLRDLVAARSPDLIVTHNLKSHFLVRLSGLHKRLPWVAFHHGYTTTDLKMRAYNRLNRLALPAADRVVTMCAPFARELEGEGVRPERIVVLHNSIRAEDVACDAVQARSFRETLGVGAGEKIVLSVGRLSREKAHADLIAAFGLLLDAKPQLKAVLIIVGDGPERQRLEAQAGSSGVAGRVRFVGQQTDVRRFYAAADALVLPSHSEGSPYVLLEAMAARLPVVATEVGGVPEMVEDGKSALLVPARDASAMAAAVARVLADEGLARALSENAAALVATRYAPDTYVRALDSLYREVIRDAVAKYSTARAMIE